VSFLLLLNPFVKGGRVQTKKYFWIVTHAVHSTYELKLGNSMVSDYQRCSVIFGQQLSGEEIPVSQIAWRRSF
jgi:hypothetical protein